MIPGPQFDSAHRYAVCMRTSVLQTQLLAQRLLQQRRKIDALGFGGLIHPGGNREGLLDGLCGGAAAEIVCIRLLSRGFEKNCRKIEMNKL